VIDRDRLRRPDTVAGVLVDVTRVWDFDDPQGSEVRLRSEAGSAEGPERQVWLTQVARALALQSRYDEAHELLDEVTASRESSPELAVRLLLERGRVLNSAGEAAAALDLFERAVDEARAGGAGPMEALLVDALHMVAIAAPAQDRLRWNEEALRVARSSSDPAARDWDASVLNNIGMCHADAGRLDEALAAFDEALAARRRIGDDVRTRVARWMVAWVYRLQGRRDEALALQMELKEELDRLGLTDPYVDEELALLDPPG
jgi:tetratricopeptide (TPR) repeat protein